MARIIKDLTGKYAGYYDCLANLIGRNVVNKCLEKGYSINTLKLEKLLIVMQGVALAGTGKPMFQEAIVPSKTGGLRIKEIYEEFIAGSAGFEDKVDEWIVLLEKQESVVDSVLNKCGKLDALDISDKYGLNKLNHQLLEDGITDKNIINGMLMGMFEKRVHTHDKKLTHLEY